jgi:GAF domain-containing protein
MDNELSKEILKEVKPIIEGELELEEKLKSICELLDKKVEYFDWTGFYLINPDNFWELMLGPYVGEPTDHVIIKFGQGICGRTAVSKKTFVVQDVAKETNYLACSPKVKSEIVVPIMKGDEFVGELDIDSHKKGPFTDEDEKCLKEICEQLAKKF